MKHNESTQSTTKLTLSAIRAGFNFLYLTDELLPKIHFNTSQQYVSKEKNNEVLVKKKKSKENKIERFIFFFFFLIKIIVKRGVLKKFHRNE